MSLLQLFDSDLVHPTIDWMTSCSSPWCISTICSWFMSTGHDCCVHRCAPTMLGICVQIGTFVVWMDLPCPIWDFICTQLRTSDFMFVCLMVASLVMQCLSWDFVLLTSSFQCWLHASCTLPGWLICWLWFTMLITFFCALPGRLCWWLQCFCVLPGWLLLPGLGCWVLPVCLTDDFLLLVHLTDNFLLD